MTAFATDLARLLSSSVFFWMCLAIVALTLLTQIVMWRERRRAAAMEMARYSLAPAPLWAVVLKWLVIAVRFTISSAGQAVVGAATLIALKHLFGIQLY